MTAKRMTKQDVPQSFGTFKPVGHAVLALPDDATLEQAQQALIAAGFTEQDLISYGAGEQFLQVESLLPRVGGTAEFGYEVALMRQYHELATQGSRWLIVYSPDAVHDERVTEVARRCGARLAVKYHRLVTEDLI